ncbi:zinc finger protein 99-like isoform X1 [Maniola jurtina]|uniref:zinc finger protein 99-like isoform X1 n=1 Tax=Maniola jurtina TaxID=191418 RepID=UPI001E68EE90|nr:zinc finger protein 99-like isoform X1 [Maniola jurtina]XP_045776604.1 zinc finger protein 99-like isoform X1 [Maniola jurtina]
MRCCLYFCKNSHDNLISTASSGPQNVTFHHFPTSEYLRSSWLLALGIEESQLPIVPLVCSEHFQRDDFIVNKNGFIQLRSNAVPSTVQVCRICLDTASKLHPLGKFNLEQAYVNVTGISTYNELNCALKLCAECAQRLLNCYTFKEKSLRAHTLLLELVKQHDLLTTQNIKSINRESNLLTSSIAKKVFQPDHCDLNLTDDKEEKFYDVSVVKDEEVGRTDHHFTSKTSDSASNRDLDVSEPKVETLNCEIKNDDESSNCNDVKFNNDFNYVGVINNDFDAEFDDVDYSNSDVTSKPDRSKVDEKGLSKKRIKKGSVKRISKKKSVKRLKGSIKRIKSKTKVKSSKERTSAKVKLKNGILKLKKERKKSVKTKIDTKLKPATDEKKLFKKTVLTYEEQLADVQQRKETANYLNARYKCTKCYKGFLDVDAYNGHMVKHTNKYGPFECDICGLHSKSRNNLCRHIVVNHSIRYSCTLCLFVTMHVGTAKSHERWHNGSKFKCPECDLEFGIRSSYLSHLRIKHPSDFACTVCGFSFIGERGIKLHMIKKHRFDVENPEGPLCKPCNIRFASETAYTQHVKVSPKHNIGGKRVRNDPLINTICWRKRPWSGKSKKEEPDAADEPVECEQCGIPLKDYWMYTQHFKKAHPDKNRTKYHRPKLLCELCGKVFNNEAQLRYHMPVHSEHKQFKCEVCSKSFGSILNLKSHVTIHSETRPSYACDFCGKTFAYQSNKYRHMTIHKGIKFSCEICDKSFNTAPERSIHVQHVHMKVPWPKRNRGPRNKTRLLMPQEDLM